MNVMNRSDLPIIGRNIPIDFVGHAQNVPAKTDTGADSSSVWASGVHMTPEGVLSFMLFGEGSPFFDSKRIETKQYKAAMVRTASGHEQLRYKVLVRVVLCGRRMRIWMNLSDRSRQDFPVLIGRRTLSGKFLVDVSTSYYHEREKTTKILNEKLEKNPYDFHIEHYENQKGE